MEIVIIAAMAMNRVIGRGQSMPWHIPGEQQRFKKTTWGHPLIMGRKTYESIGRPLPGRRNIVISRNKHYLATGCETTSTLTAALELCADSEKVFVIGGEQVFAQALPRTDTIILTTILREVEGDTFFPVFEQHFDMVSRELVTETDPYMIEVYRRKQKG